MAGVPVSWPTVDVGMTSVNRTRDRTTPIWIFSVAILLEAC
jgi:hypothetical protein